MKNKINAIILAAGMGNRLSPLTEDIPKGMMKLFEKSEIILDGKNFYFSCVIFKIYDEQEINSEDFYYG